MLQFPVIVNRCLYAESLSVAKNAFAGIALRCNTFIKAMQAAAPSNLRVVAAGSNCASASQKFATEPNDVFKFVRKDWLVGIAAVPDLRFAEKIESRAVNDLGLHLKAVRVLRNKSARFRNNELPTNA